MTTTELNKTNKIPEGAATALLSPGIESAPEIRWWLAGGSHTSQTLHNSLDEIASMGLGGIEILTMPEEHIDRSLFGWDSKAWYDTTKLLLEEATARGMALSFTSGPNWMPAIPGLDVNGDATSQELDFNSLLLGPGECFDGVLEPHDLMADHTPMREPTPRKQRFLRAVAAKLIGDELPPYADLSRTRNIDLMFAPDSAFETVYLANGSAVDLTDLVREQDGEIHLRWTAPDDGKYIIFTFWMHSAAQTARASYQTAYVINHLDKAGFEAQKAYWNEHIFTEEIRDLVKKNGRVNFFQDSLEIDTNELSGLFWSSRFLDEFKARRGYDPTLLLPMAIKFNVGFIAKWVTKEADNKPRFLFEGCEKQHRQLLNDINQTQTELYMEEYLAPIREWLNSVGIKLRAQTSYGMASVEFELSEPIKCVDIHETETLEMADEIYYYLHQSGGVHLTGKNIFSAETGATNGGAYYLTVNHYLDKIHRLYAAGINRVILHGYAAKVGPDGAFDWPGYEGLRFDTSERWGTRSPYGKHMPALTSYLRRMQAALRMGTPKLDVGVLNLAYTSVNVDFWYGFVRDYKDHLSDVFPWDDKALLEAGYTYEFFSPAYLSDKSISHEKGRFDSGRTDYKALVVYQEGLPLSAAESLLVLAKAGIPVVFVGDAASQSPYMNDDEASLAAVIGEISLLPNVRRVASAVDAPAALAELGVMPRTKYLTPAPVRTLFRQADDFAILYTFNPAAEAVELPVSVDGEYIPYAFDAWNGGFTALGEYSQVECRTLCTVSLQPHDALILILVPGKGEARGVADKRSFTELGSWGLTVESWTPGAKKTVTEVLPEYTKNEVTYETDKEYISVHLDKLAAWKDIPEIGPSVSGMGTYTTVINVPDEYHSDDGARLRLLAPYGTVSARLNGVTLPNADPFIGELDISDYLHSGDNRLEVEVSSTLCNQFIAQGKMKVGSPILLDTKVELCPYGLLTAEISL